MAVTDIASRTYNHGWRLDPIVRSLLDTDFYKLLMLQMIREFYPDQRVTFSVINRSRHVRLAEIIDEGELRAQLDHARSIRFSKKELIWLAGNTFYGKTQMFSPDFINWLAKFRLPEYELHKVDGQYELHFHGPWTHTTMWEIPALAILNELRSRQVTKGQGRFALDVLYARAKAKLWTKVERLRKLDGLRLSDFGTRRRHGFLWQRWCVEAVKEGLGESFTGTSNVLLAMDNDLEAIGTNAHELPMVAAALANDDTELRWAPYRILDQWRHTYGGNLLIALPDAFGTKSFLRDAPEWVADWTGFRPDSAPPIAAGEEIIKWWKQKDRDPREKLLVFSDAMDVGSIEETYRHFAGRVRISFGWGTNLTNDFVGCAPDGSVHLDPISDARKVRSGDGRPAGDRRHLADDRDRIEIDRPVRRATDEIIGQVGAPAKAYPDAAGEMTVGLFDRPDIHGVGKNQQFLPGIAVLLLPPLDDFLACRDRRRTVGAKTGPVRHPFGRIPQERFGAEGVGKRDQKIAAIGMAPLIEDTVRRPAKFIIIICQRRGDHRQFVGIGSDRFQIVVHRHQDIGGACEGRPQALLDGLDAPALPPEAMAAPRPDIGKAQAFQLAQPLYLAPELGLCAGIENVEDKPALSLHHLARAQLVEYRKRRNLPHRRMRPGPMEVQFVLAVHLAKLVFGKAERGEPVDEVGRKPVSYTHLTLPTNR